MPASNGRPRLDVRPAQRFRFLVVVEEVPNKKQVTWTCQCDCGNTTTATSSNLVKGAKVSCGCWHNRRGGLSSTKAGRVWRAMWYRCSDPEDDSYHRYGGRGITVCDRWKSLEAFVEDMGQPEPGQTLERTENAKGYSPANCRWATRAEQARNTRRTIMITFQGKTQCLKDWSKDLGIKYPALYARIQRGIVDPEVLLRKRRA